MDTRELLGDFTWMWNDEFFVETSQGNYIWSCPDYGGDNTLKKYRGTLKKYCTENNIQYGRSKGKRIIGEYCGPDVRLAE